MQPIAMPLIRGVINGIAIIAAAVWQRYGWNPRYTVLIGHYPDSDRNQGQRVVIL